MEDEKFQLRPGQAALIERLAVDQEHAGIPPALAKVFSLLMVSDKPQLTFEEIREVLGISKSATSGAINQLLAIRKIEYVTYLGDRKRYFRARISNLREDIPKIATKLSEAATIYTEILAQRPADTPEHNANMQLIVDFLGFISQELPVLVQKFENRKS